MKKDEAVDHLQAMMFALQKLRSIAQEGIDPGFRIIGEEWPYLYGEKCPLSVLAKILDSYERTGELEPLALYNMVYIATSLEPLIRAAATVEGDIRFPRQPEISWLRGWEA